MDKLQTEIKLSWWPTPQDYNEAIQVPRAYLEDSELKTGLVYTDAIGLPRAVTGSFASVYRMHCASRDFALRLFLKNIRDQDERYALISDFVQHDDLPYTVTFDLLKKGIKIREDWFPALKMEWVEGVQFDDYIIEHLAKPAMLEQLSTKFITMMDEMRHAGIAHGDLQHGNIIMCQDQIRLVDYDGMYVPAMKGFEASELGHRNYQHPQRANQHFGPYLDNFSAWVIYTSIKALQIDSRLLHQLGGGDDCLLFRQSDFTDSTQSAAFAALERHDSAELQALGRFVRAQLKQDLADIPHLQLPVPNISEAELIPVADTANGVRLGPRLLRGTLPEWLDEKNIAGLSRAKSAQGQESAGVDSWTVVARPTQSPSWIIPTAGPSGQSVPAVSSAQTFNPKNLPVPQELTTTSVPREVQFYSKCAKSSPVDAQIWMILNPAVWIMISCFFSFNPGEGSDGRLATQGIRYPAIVSDVNHYLDHNSVSFQYTINGETYTETQKTASSANLTKGSKGFVYALPDEPHVTESLNQIPGTVERRRHPFNAAAFFLSLAINVFCLALIWSPALKDRSLAKYGVPVFAKINNKVGAPHGRHIIISYQYKGQLFNETLAVSEYEFSQLKKDDTELILCYPDTPSACVLYKFCRYHPIDLIATRSLSAP